MRGKEIQDEGKWEKANGSEKVREAEGKKEGVKGNEGRGRQFIEMVRDVGSG